MCRHATANQEAQIFILNARAQYSINNIPYSEGLVYSHVLIQNK